MTETATEGDSVSSEGPSAWSNPRGGWHFHDGEFVGLHWFLWAGQSWASVVVPAATRLQALLSGFAGSPDEVVKAGGPATGFRACWAVDGHNIQMYVHGPTSGRTCRTSVQQPFSCTSITPAAAPRRTR